jgi:RNA polymerase sigma-70 factor, ECF subfamily
VDNLKENAISGVYIYNGSYMAVAKAPNNISKDHEERFLKAFEEYSDALFRHAFLRINDRERAVDVVHDTFAKVWTYVRNGHEIKSYRPFLYKVLNNLIIDEYRKIKESSLDSLLAVEGVDEGTFSELHEDTVDSLIATLDGKKAFEFLAELPDVYREVLILRFVDELGPKEISELIEETENVISVRLHRGLKLLQELVARAEGKAKANRSSAKSIKNE